MLTEKRSTKIGAALLIFAVLLRLLTGLWGMAVKAIRQPEATEQTLQRPTNGPAHWVSVPTAEPMEPSAQTQPLPSTTAPPQPTRPIRVPVSFSAADMQYIRVQYAQDCAHRPSLEALLLQPLPAQFSEQTPMVLIVHTHGSESYTRQPGQDYQESTDYRTLDTAYNVVALGDQLEQLLAAAGIPVLHDRQIHDYPSYNAAYSNSRESVADFLAQYPQICMVLDLHRDAALNSDGTQYATKAMVDGQKVAQLMLVLGTNASGKYHPDWQENLSVALKLQVLLEKQAPGITRQTILRAQRFNHDLASGAMIVEIGAAGNTLAEAEGAVPILAQALIRLLLGEEA